MAYHCSACDREFTDAHALSQHLHSTAHPADAQSKPFKCEPCKKSFKKQSALNSHLRHAGSHLSVNCEPCGKSFVNQDALDQHLQDSPVHELPFACATCKRSFKTKTTLTKHLRYSPVHTLSVKCEPCNRSFINQETLDQHLQDSPAHAQTFTCEPCNRPFVNQQALDQHQSTAYIHQRHVNTPLDNFFRSFPGFAYDPSLPPAISFAKLRKQKKWRSGQNESNEAWVRYQDALEAELRMWFGAEDDLTAWHALCRAIGISPVPATCERCEQAARRTHVNIVDLIEWGRGDRNKTVHTFRDVEDLKGYTRKTGKIFRRTVEIQGNIVLRHLLRKIFV